ncbi:MAG: hypothetical protein EBS05_15755 [Proteobacteria bacterium]|nr:hypothetical protein [Pseudomonadota bacterium]
MSDTEEHIRTQAAHALSKYGEAAQSSVPSLIKSLADPSKYVRQYATNALKRIDPTTATRAGIP